MENIDGIMVNGTVHVQLAIRNFEECAPFYAQLMTAFGLQTLFDDERLKFWTGGRTSLAITRCPEEDHRNRFDQQCVELHHVCFHARSRADVDGVYELAQRLGAKIIQPPQEGPWAPGYYAVSFEDPDGIRLEVRAR
jgi:catechol 2,3-dioxygenase-like lactoylglutathione lyase family enzyme